MNSIYDNRRSGITVAGKSQPNIVDNEVLRNTAVGINIRDMASGLFLRNYAFGNLVQMAIITKSAMNIKEIKKENFIKGEVQLPLPVICSVF
jgi:parallel beta-helix repeat protein